MKDIARFAALSMDFTALTSYILHQIPLILPIAIPISCLIASILLMQRLSQYHELTTLRASGLSINQIIAPLFYVGILLSIINFFIVSEITSRCRTKSKTILFEQSSFNPILLLQRQQLLNMKNCFIDLKTNNNTTKAKDFTYIGLNNNTKKLQFFSIRKLFLRNEQLYGKNISIISYFPSCNKDALFIENQKKTFTPATSLSYILKPDEYKLSTYYLPFRMLLACLKHHEKNRLIFLFEPRNRRDVVPFALSTFKYVQITQAAEIPNKIKEEIAAILRDAGAAL